jgi:hypothetical protein
MSKKLNARDVQKLFQYDEEGFSSSDESDDFCEEQNHPSDKTLNILENQINTINGNNDDEEYETASLSSSSSEENLEEPADSIISGICTSKSAMSIASISNTSDDRATINMSVESIAQNNLTSIPTTSFFKKPLPTEKPCNSNFSFPRSNQKISKKKQGQSSVKKKAEIKKILKHSEKHYYGKTTKVMEKNNIKPHLWHKEPQLDSFVSLEQFNLKPSLTSECDKLTTISDFLIILLTTKFWT